jgi:hypothetical protein
MKIQSGYCYLDVKRGRKKLLKETSAGKRIPVTIKGFINGPFSADDGESIEFEVEVMKVTTK